MIKEFTDESQARALAAALGLHITKRGDYFIVGNDKYEICDKY